MTDPAEVEDMADAALCFLTTLRESLADFDRRLLAVEKRLDELDARFDESPREAAHRELKKAALHHAAMARAQAVGEHEHHREGEAPADFLAPPLPWWARSPVIG